MYLDVEGLAGLVRSKRKDKSLREAAKEIGSISPSTLSRVENGKIPDMENFLSLCNWLEIPPTSFFKNIEDMGNAPVNTPDAIAFILRSDKNLSPAIANALVSLIRGAYNDLCRY